MNNEKLLKNQKFLVGLLSTYNQIPSGDDASFKFVPELASDTLLRLFSLHKQISINQSRIEYSKTYSNILNKLFCRYTELFKIDSLTASPEVSNFKAIHSILKLNQDRKRSYQRKIFPRVKNKLKHLKQVNLDYLDITKKLTNENAHSDILAALIDADRCPNISSKLLAKLLKAALYSSPNFNSEIKLNSGRKVIVSAEVERIINLLKTGKLHTTCIREKNISKDNDKSDSTSNNNMRIDILIKSPAAYIAIENKVYSFEHDKQTVHYYDWLKCNCVGDTVPLGILLSPSKMVPKCHYFGILGFEDVKWSLVEALSNKKVTTEEYTLGRSYLNSLENLQN